MCNIIFKIHIQNKIVHNDSFGKSYQFGEQIQLFDKYKLNVKGSLSYSACLGKHFISIKFAIFILYK
jgi:hypothetical protein